jgi:hypothetical protein
MNEIMNSDLHLKNHLMPVPSSNESFDAYQNNSPLSAKSPGFSPSTHKNTTLSPHKLHESGKKILSPFWHNQNMFNVNLVNLTDIKI